MGDLNNSFNKALRNLLERNGKKPDEGTAPPILGEEINKGGFCESCYWEETVVNIQYFEDSILKIYEYLGSSSDLLHELLREDKEDNNG